MGQGESITVKSEVIVCPKCKGKGTEENRDGAYDAVAVKCTYCSGNRVVVEKIVHENIRGSNNLTFI